MTYFSELPLFQTVEKDAGGGFILRATLKSDEAGMKPWENDDFTPEPYSKSGAKAPYEYRLSNGDFVDFRALVQHERKAGGCSKAQANENALSAVKRLNGFIEGRWYYVGVIVELVHPETVGVLDSESIWGLESDCPDYCLQWANDYASGLMKRLPELTKEACERLKRESAMLGQMIEIHDKEAAL